MLGGVFCAQNWKDHMADEENKLPLPSGNEKKCIDTCKHLFKKE